MGLLSTLKIKKTSTSKVGNVQAQPVSSWNSQIEDNIKSNLSNETVSKIPLSDVSGLVLNENNNFEKIGLLSVDKIINGLTQTNTNFRFSNENSSFNNIVPSYLSQLSPSLLRGDDTENFQKSKQTFGTYENLTGISNQRPEIIMLTQFKPLFFPKSGLNSHTKLNQLKKSGVDPMMTGAGWYLDAQVNTRNLQADNMLQLVKSATDKNFRLKNIIKERTKSFGTTLDTLNSSALFLLQLVNKSNKLKDQLDLREEAYAVRPQAVLQNHILSSTKIKNNVSSNSLQKVASSFLPADYNLVDVLIQLGYTKTNVERLFSSTKIWKQILFEFKKILKYHSLNFIDLIPTEQKNDNESIKLTNEESDLFTLSRINTVNNLSISDITRQPASDVASLVTTIDRGFASIYETGVTFQTEEARIAALCNVLSKELNYSKGLALPSTIRTLSDGFDYSVNENGNNELFDSVIGTFGENVTEVPANVDKSLSDLSNYTPSTNTSVFTFESEYIDGLSGLIRPGTEYYIDDIFKNVQNKKFDLSKLELLSTRLKSAEKDFKSIVNSLNLFQSSDIDSTTKNNVSLLSEPPAFISSILDKIVSKEGVTKPAIQNDRLTAIYSQAKSSSKIKSILFLYTLNRINRSYDSDGRLLHQSNENIVSTPITEELIQLLSSTLEQETRYSQSLLNSGNSISSSLTQTISINDSTVKLMLRQGSDVSSIVELFMIQVFNAFRLNRTFANQRTLYGNYLDTVIMMVAFDLIISIIGEYGNQKIKGKRQIINLDSSSNSKIDYLISVTRINFQVATSDLINRLELERALIHQTIWAITNTLNVLNTNIDKYIEFVSSPSSLFSLSVITDILPNINELQLLLSEQQIMLLGATISDMIGSLNNRNLENLGDPDLDGDGDFDRDDQIKLLDDSVISPRLKNALYGLMSSNEFTDERAVNKRILTIGVPLGFTRKLKQKVNIENIKLGSFDNKQKDIINISVYKIDLLNQDIIYKPNKYLFELSRFPVRNESHFKSIPNDPTILQILQAIPTRDYGESFEEGNSSISYWDGVNAGDLNNALNSKSYDFLSDNEKFNIINNHLMSFMLEVYIKLLTGISVAEQQFELNTTDIVPSLFEEKFMKQLIDFKLDESISLNASRDLSQSSISSPLATNKNRIKIPEPRGGVLFRSTQAKSQTSTMQGSTNAGLTNISGLPGNVQKGYQNKTIQNTGATRQGNTINSAINQSNSITSKEVPALVSAFKTISQLSEVQSSLSEPLRMSRRLLRPRQFDRVFNVIIDPDEFEVDYDKTMKTKEGRSSFESLVKNGIIIQANLSQFDKLSQKLAVNKFNFQNGNDSNDTIYIQNSRSKDQGDLMFEKYFVTIETFDESNVI